MANEKKRESKRKKTAALKYNPEKDKAPRIVASGSGNIAEKILEKARQENIPIKEDRDLVEVLSRLNVGEEIPEELYSVIAEILSFFYKLDELKK